MTDKLNPCPFCGDPQPTFTGYEDRTFVMCGNYSADVDSLNCDGDVRESWNRRATPHQAAEPAPSEDARRLDDLEAAKHYHRLVRWDDDLGCWLTPGNFEHSTFREALDEVLEGYRKSEHAIDGARLPADGAVGEGSK